MVNPFMTQQRNYRLPSKPTAEQAEKFRKQVESGRYRAQTAEKKNLRVGFFSRLSVLDNALTLLAYEIFLLVLQWVYSADGSYAVES